MTFEETSAICQANQLSFYRVGEVYEIDDEGHPIPEQDKDKWFVAVPHGLVSQEVLRTIPLAATEEEAMRSAIVHLGLVSDPPKVHPFSDQESLLNPNSNS